MIDLALRQRFEALIRERGGLSLREQEAPALQKTLLERTAARRLASPQDYLELLSGQSPRAEAEWTQLWMRLTNQESYFFRDPEQLGVLSRHILPELMARSGHAPTLRIWSAGCSTGEEPYTLAMMAAEIPALRDWRVTIVATDISEAALARARRGVYGDWSFRALDEARRARFFTARGKEWEVAPSLREKVRFASNNLFADAFPSREGELHDLDLIVCRNVFIYFDREAVAQVLQKFRATLRPGGFLVCGHAELHDIAPGDFQVRAFPQSLIYQRSGASQTETALPTRLGRANSGAPLPVFQVAPLSTRPASPSAALATSPLPSVRPAHRIAPLPLPAPVSRAAAPRDSPLPNGFPTPVMPRPIPALLPSPVATLAAPTPAEGGAVEVLERAKTQIRAGKLAVGLETVESLLEREPGFYAGWCLLAQAQADAGRLDEAQNSCERALKLSPLAALPYGLQARIAEERGARETAKMLLKKVIYLHPRSIWAPLELSAIYRREGDFQRAAQMQRAALGWLDELNDEAEVPAEHALETPMRAGELKRQLRAELEAQSAP